MAYGYIKGPYYKTGPYYQEGMYSNATVVTSSSVNFTAENGEYYYILDQTSIGSILIKDYGYVSNEGTISAGTVENTGTLLMYFAGSAENITVESGGWIGLVIDTIHSYNITDGDSLSISASSEDAPHETLDFSYEYGSNQVSDLLIPSFAGLTVEAEYVFSVENISVKGRLEVNGCSVENINVLSGGGMLVRSGTTVSDLTVENGGNVFIRNKGESSNLVFTGDFRLGGSLHMHSYDEDSLSSAAVCETLIFDLTDRTPDDSVMVDYLSSLDCDTFAVSVSTDQEEGVYWLAGSASEFQSSITVSCSDNVLGTVSLAQTLEVGDSTYSLFLNNSSLYFSIQKDPGVVAGVEVDGNVYTFHGDNQSGVLSSALAVSGKYVLNGYFGDMTGTVTLYNGNRKAGTGSIKNGVLTFNKNKSVLLDSANGVTLQVTAKKGNNTEYFATLQPESETSLFNQPDTVGNTFITATNLGSITNAGPVAREWVGYGDEFDVYAFTLDTAAKLRLDLTATDAANFTIYDSNGKSVLKTNVKAGGAVTTKAKQLNPGNYYLAVQSTNAMKGGAASYSVGVNAGTEFFGNIFTSPLTVNCQQSAGKTNVNFSWNAPENAGSRKITYFVSIDGGKETKVSKTSFTTKKLSMTDHTARIYAKDNFGNVSEVTEVNFSIADTTAPKVSGLSAAVTDDTAVVKFKASDNIGVTGFLVTMDNIDNYFSAEEYNNAGGLVFGNLDRGQHTVTVRAVDAAGNISNAATKRFSVKYEKRTTYIPNGSASAIFNNDIPVITLDGNVSAQNSQLYTFTAQNNPEFLHFWINDGVRLSSAVQMDVYRKTGADANGSFADKFDHETFPASGRDRGYTLVTEPNRTYFLEISAGSPVDYTINGSVSEIKLGSSSFDTAEELQSEFFDGCLASINRQDYYRFTLYGGVNIQLSANSFAKTNWELYDSGMSLLRSASVDTYADFSIDLSAGDYYLKVALPSSWKYDVDDAVCTYSGFITFS